MSKEEIANGEEVTKDDSISGNYEIFRYKEQQKMHGLIERLL